MREPFEKLPSLSTPCGQPSLHDCHKALVDHPLPCKRHRLSPPTNDHEHEILTVNFKNQLKNFDVRFLAIDFLTRVDRCVSMTLTKIFDFSMSTI